MYKNFLLLAYGAYKLTLEVRLSQHIDAYKLPADKQTLM